MQRERIYRIPVEGRQEWRNFEAIRCLSIRLIMGQHFASLREFFRMDGERQSSEASINVIQPAQLETMHQDGTENFQNNENNGNVPALNLNLFLHDECKADGNLDNVRLNLELDNHNSRFETLYSQPVEAQDSICSNGNITSELCLKQQEVYRSSSGGSNTSSSSEDSPINPPPLRRSSKTLSFGKRKGNIFICVYMYVHTNYTSEI